MAKTLNIGDANFQSEVAASAQPVLLDFTAAWCGPCRAQAPVIEELAESYAGRLKVGQVDVDQNPGLVQAFQVMSMPTLLLLKGGKVAQAAVGYRGKADLTKMVEQVLAA